MPDDNRFNDQRGLRAHSLKFKRHIEFESSVVLAFVSIYEYF